MRVICTATGGCRSCGETKDFANSLPEEEEPGERHQVQLGRIPETRAEGKARRAEAIEQIRIRKEATNMAQKQSTGAIRIRQLAETKRRFFRMVAEDRSVEDIEAMLNEAPGGPPSGTAVRHWWAEARKRAGTTSHIVEVAVPIPQPAPSKPALHPVLQALVNALPEAVMKQRKQRWMNAFDAAYDFVHG